MNFRKSRIGFGQGLTCCDWSRAFSLLLDTGESRDVRLFLGKSRVGSGCPVYTRSENGLVGKICHVLRRRRIEKDRRIEMIAQDGSRAAH
jgi:hypothetical protein